MNVALSIGHHPAAQGCDTIDGKWTEYSFWATQLPLLADTLQRMGHEAHVVNRSDSGGKTPSYAAAACNAVNADLAIEFHFNSASSRAASGTETFYWATSARGKIAAEMIQQAMVEVLKLPDRGCKTIGHPSENAYEFFHRTSMPAILVEPAFAASNVTDNDRLQTRIGDLIIALAIAIDGYAKATGQ